MTNTTSTITILDGGMGRELARRNAPFRQPEWSALALYEAPSAVEAVHLDFINAGAEIITTNSYAVVPFHIGETRFQADSRTLASLAGKLAQQAVQKSGKNVKIAGSIPPLFGSYRPDLFNPQRVSEIARPLIDSLDPYADFWLLETQSYLAEVQAVVPLLTQKPVWVSFTLEDSEPTPEPCLRSGETVKEMVQAVSHLGVSAILFNCCQPEVIEQAIAVVKANLPTDSTIQIGAYANAFPPQPKNATANDGLDEIRQDLSPTAYLAWAKKWQQAGATIIGGCCGITPEHIAELAKALK